uniref:Uncharacterized protein n=1 Tax=Anguilla anguilla TaxID=7936 RepID=A0A0E9TVG6_ANGAN
MFQCFWLYAAVSVCNTNFPHIVNPFIITSIRTGASSPFIMQTVKLVTVDIRNVQYGCWKC